MKIFNKTIIFLPLLLIFVLASCHIGTPNTDPGYTIIDPNDKSTYDSNYEYDLETHYHIKGGKKIDIQEHTFGNDGKCNRCGFLLFAYAKELNDDDTPYILQVGEEITPLSYYGGQVINFRYVSSNPDVVSTTKTGKITALKVGNATISAYFQDVLESTISVKVIDNEKIISDTTHLDEFDALMNSFNDKTEFSYSFYTLIDGKKDGYEIKYSEDPLYDQYNILGNHLESDEYLTIVQSENGELYKYSDFGKNGARRTYLENANLESIIGDEKIFISDATEDINLEKANITKIDDNHYSLKAYIKDMVTDQEALFGEIDNQIKESLNNAIMIFDVLKQENKLTIKYTIQMRINAVYDIVPYTFDMVFEFDFNPISRYDFSKTSFYAPEKLKDAAYSSLDELVYIKEKKGTHLKYHLEEGAYVFLSLDQKALDNTYYLAYDKDLNEIDLRTKLKDIDIYNNVVYIGEEGDYYFTVYPYDEINSTWVKLTKCNFLVRDDKEFISDSNQILGSSDYVKYVYNNASNNSIFYFTNTSNNQINMYMEGSTNSKGESHVAIDKDETIIIKPLIGENYYYIYSINNVAYNYSFSLEEIGLADEDLNTNIITTEFSEYYSIGIHSNDKVTLNLKIEKAGLYKFEKYSIDGISDCKVSVSPYTSSYDNISYALSEGDYKISIQSKKKIDYFMVRYTVVDTSDKDVNITLNELVKSSNPSIDLHIKEEIDSIQIDNTKLIDTQIIRYHFTLDEDTNIIYSPSQVEIYDSVGNKVSLDVKPYHSYNFYHTLNFKKGSYYAICILDANDSPYYTNNKSFTLGTYKGATHSFNWAETDEIDLANETLTDTYTWTCDAHYYKFTPTADINIIFRCNLGALYNNVVIISENLDLYELKSNGAYIFREGFSYYIMFYNGGSGPGEINFRFESR